ncbi:MAG TPA: CidA/LrgA family protein [Anaerovoracaceae bacterium]|nr:CidA/LrgA family protein [Anaerovoracaceae bacterium]
MVLKQVFIILSALFLGYAVSIVVHLPIPANVIGFALLFAALCMGIIKLHHVDRVSDFIIKYLAVFFVTPTIGIMQYFDLIGEQFLHIIVPLMASILIGFFVAAKVTELFIQLAERNRIKKGLGGRDAE